MHNFHHGGGNGFNGYGGNNHRNGNFTPKRHNGLGNFSSYARSFEHTSYDDYGERVKIFDQKKKTKSIIKVKRCGKKQLFMPSQRVAKVENVKPSMLKEFLEINELSTIEVEENVV
ncbi:hypothetical protein M9H77_37026 [Catharanthus roseus]|uniref:Uncharacterized protein n=1 Tax=Catharanthus roseus TaxID=4058 RepID=A0ACB9ZTH3_CATRO|nr:hypothetical protein M9H77_37026 [Catharanthus roseus]